jgi:hypothetical protein
MNDLSNTVENDLIPEINKLKELDRVEGVGIKDYNPRAVRLNEIVDTVSFLFFNSIIYTLCLDLDIVKKFFTPFDIPIIV